MYTNSSYLILYGHARCTLRCIVINVYCQQIIILIGQMTCVLYTHMCEYLNYTYMYLYIIRQTEMLYIFVVWHFQQLMMTSQLYLYIEIVLPKH